MNIHTPERQEGETREAYRRRREMSRATLRQMTLRGDRGGRGVPSSREQHRDAMRSSGSMKKRTRYADGIARVQAKRNRSKATTAYPHDAHGAFTMIGKGPTRRMWLGGISAIRGY